MLDSQLPVQATKPKIFSSAAIREQGINLSGYFKDESGWGAAGRAYARALRRLGAPHALNDVSVLTNNRSDDSTILALCPNNPYEINLVCVDPSQHFAFLSMAGPGYFEGHYNIGAWAWELPRFPSQWFDRFAFYDEIWVTTSFVANALAPFAPVPVVRVPPVLVPTRTGSRDTGRKRLQADPDELIFLFIFDFHSHMARKNPLAVIDAFRLAFSPRDPVRLVLKCANGAADPRGLAEMQARAEGCNISIFDRYWSTEEMRDLKAASDVYVSLHRSEGTGLTITDAMALGKPVIATGWSGNMDFMNVANSFPVKYELVEIENGVGPYREGEIWADPSVEHAAELMQQVLNNRAEAMARGAAAQRDIQSGFSEASIAKLIQNRLRAVAIHRDLTSFKQEKWSAFVNYQRQIAVIRKTVCRLVPKEATVAVVSKGDDALLQLGGRRAWHFPCTPAGVYAGYHPADSAAAILHLRELVSRGAGYLVFPPSSFWWLDHYAEFKRYLEKNHRRIWNSEDCIIYGLGEADRAGMDSCERMGGS